LSSNDSLILLSFRLPVAVKKEKETGLLIVTDSNSPIYPTIFKMRSKYKNFKWIGWPGIVPKNEEEKIAITCTLSKQNCIPIFMDKNMMILYQIFIDQHLQPMLHNYYDVNKAQIS
jgi:trehalose 6-phosphate synthase/phosphatase